MISTLHIKNIGIIDDLSIDFNEGLNILTGETGAGKTLIIQSLEIISGGRFSKEIIRKIFLTKSKNVEKCRNIIFEFILLLDYNKNKKEESWKLLNQKKFLLF